MSFDRVKVAATIDRRHLADLFAQKAEEVRAIYMSMPMAERHEPVGTMMVGAETQLEQVAMEFRETSGGWN